jgi:hypothetical protein
VSRVADLLTELVTEVTAISDFRGRGYTIYSIEEVTDMIEQGLSYPLACVAYIGAEPVQNNVVGASGKGRGPVDSALVEKRFSILIGVEYNWVDAENTMPVATDLLDGVRGRLMGFQGVGGRPWRFLAESRLDSNIVGVIFYEQVWATSCIEKGNSV